MQSFKEGILIVKGVGVSTAEIKGYICKAEYSNERPREAQHLPVVALGLTTAVTLW
jgi:hypothetical protein